MYHQECHICENAKLKVTGQDHEVISICTVDVQNLNKLHMATGALKLVNVVTCKVLE